MNSPILNSDRLLNDIIEASGIHPSRVFNVVIFGSRVYGTFQENSDWDIIIVANNSVEAVEVKCDMFNIHIYTPDRFKRDLEWHRPNNLECIFAPEWAKLKSNIDYSSSFNFDIRKLRHAALHISRTSWSKANKKIDSEYRIALKSLFHSLRILMFSKQIIEFGHIVDFTCANWIWEKLSSGHWSRESLYGEFGDFRNVLLDYFKTPQKT